MKAFFNVLEGELESLTDPQHQLRLLIRSHHSVQSVYETFGHFQLPSVEGETTGLAGRFLNPR